MVDIAAAMEPIATVLATASEEGTLYRTISVCVCMCVCVCVCVWCVCACACVYVSMYVCHVCMYVRVCVCASVFV
jgi:hypothetical protein